MTAVPLRIIDDIGMRKLTSAAAKDLMEDHSNHYAVRNIPKLTVSRADCQGVPAFGSGLVWNTHSVPTQPGTDLVIVLACREGYSGAEKEGPPQTGRGGPTAPSFNGRTSPWRGRNDGAHRPAGMGHIRLMTAPGRP